MIQRREFVSKAGAAGITSSLGLLAGCISSGLQVEDTDARVTTFGNVIVRVLVANDSSSSKSATLIGQVDVKGGDTYTQRRDISVTGDGSNTYDLEFDIAMSDSLSASEFEYSAEIED